MKGTGATAVVANEGMSGGAELREDLWGRFGRVYERSGGAALREDFWGPRFGRV